MHPLTEKILAQDPRATARACRLCDDRVPGYLDLLRGLFPHTGRAFLVGVTGNPGAGKSTVVDRLVEQYRKAGKRVAVVAVDPTSPYSGGAILGDRIRMQRHFEDPGVFIRSVATRGALGGLSRSAWDIVNVLDAWGADVVIVETVGVGQDELEITRTAHSTVVVMAPGLGDDVQANKAGLMECADVFAVNKADREGADATVRDLELMIALGGEVLSAGAHSRGHGAGHLDLAQAKVKHGEGVWVPPIVRCVATRNQGVDALVAKLEEHRQWLASEHGQRRAEQRQREQLRGFLREALVEEAAAALGARIDEAAARVQRREVDPYTASEALVAAFRRGSLLLAAHVLGLPGAGAEVSGPAAIAGGALGRADAAPMEDQHVRDQVPVLGGEDRGQLGLDLLWRGLASPAEALAQPLHVGVDHDALGHAKADPQHHVGGLSPHPRQRREGLEIVGHFPPVTLDELARQGHDVP
jgi:LAO/AO transport system kinase